MAFPPLPKTMKAWLLSSFNTPYHLSTLPLPTLQHPHDILIRVQACSYCHTDAVVALGTIVQPPLPHIGCHEYAGTVVGLPPGKEECNELRAGDRVAVRGMGNHVCGRCRECRNPSGPMPDAPGWSVLCSLAGVGLGVDRPGGFREYAVVDSRQVGRIPEELSAVEVAPLMCAGLTVYAALKKCELQPGDRVGIVGCGGGLGHLGIQFATKMGLVTTGVDVAPRALELARDLGTNATIIDASKEKAKDVRQKMGEEDGWTLTSEMGLDAVIILPESQEGFDYGINLLRDGGRAVVISFPLEGFHVSAMDLVIRRLRIEGSLIGGNNVMREMFEFCIAHGVRAKTTTYPFEQLNELVEDYKAGKPGKLVLDLGES